MILGEIVFQIFHFFEYCLFCLCMKWRRSKKELICQNSNIPQISCFSVLFVVYHFRCNILDCPTKSFHHFLLLLFLTILIHIVTLFPIEFICPPKIHPKSQTLTLPSSSINRFSALRSRCTTPSQCISPTLPNTSLIIPLHSYSEHLNFVAKLLEW